MASRIRSESDLLPAQLGSSLTIKLAALLGDECMAGELCEPIKLASSTDTRGFTSTLEAFF
ncbi:hypothetical protein BpHYR1_054492 [Brachionus plicatilis]|uniref:Uncharacterized protein n=1 Tax=Brachionus plicatilis TaxID=10195 RepID=A0A3M7S871_BRAPC|nr:hypothetical protein BpHYR1_054492 [Brachionus plicatilis]